MEYIKKFLDGTITLSELTSTGFKKEIETLAENAKIAGTEIAQIAVKKVTKFIKTVTQKLQKANLKKFFKTGNNLWVDNSGFQEFLKDALSDCDEASEKDATYHWHANTATAHDNIIWPEIGQEIIDMNTAEGRVEARDRLNYLRTEIENQSKGKSGTLLNNGYANVIGIFKLKSNRVLAVGADWGSVNGRWHCYGFGAGEWFDGLRFLSCNGVA